MKLLDKCCKRLDSLNSKKMGFNYEIDSEETFNVFR